MKKRHYAIVFISFGTAVVLSYWNSLNVPFQWDGKWVILNDPKFYTLEGIRKIILEFNRALTNLSYAFNLYFFGKGSFSFHVVSVIIHILNTSLLFVFIRMTLGLKKVKKFYSRNRNIIAYGVSILFAVHPVHTESVTYIYQRSTEIVFFFFLLTLVLYIKARLAEKSRVKTLLYITTVICCILAFASKGNSAVLPLFVLLYEYFFFQERKLTKSFKIQIIAVGLIFLVLASIFSFMYFDKWQSRYQKRLFTPSQRMLTQTRVVLHYVSLVFYPSPSRLKIAYDFPFSTGLFSPLSTFFSILTILFLLGIAVAVRKKHRILSFSILWYFGNLVIESSIFPLLMVFEHRLYLPSVGLLLIFVTLLTGVGDRLMKKGSPRFLNFRWEFLIVGLLVCLLMFWTFQRNKDWQTRKRLWTDAVEKSPGSPVAHQKLGFVYLNSNRYRKAISEFGRALELNPDRGFNYVCLGTAFVQSGRIKKGEKYLNKALRMNPDSSKAHEGKALVYLSKGKFDPAYREAKKALELTSKPDSSLFNTLGIIQNARGDYSESERFFKKAQLKGPDNLSVVLNRALNLEDLGEKAKAVKLYKKVTRRAGRDSKTGRKARRKLNRLIQNNR